MMDTHKPVAEMLDLELIREYAKTDFDNGDWRRTDALIGEMNKRDMDF